MMYITMLYKCSIIIKGFNRCTCDSIVVGVDIVKVGNENKQDSVVDISGSEAGKPSAPNPKAGLSSGSEQ